MKNEKKITVLRKALDMLKKGFEYSFGGYHCCNCGVVMQASGLHEITILEEMNKIGFYEEIVNESGHCRVTGLPFGIVQRTMMENGFRKRDIIELENLSNKKVINKLGVIKREFYRSVKENLISYLTAWIELLEENEQQKVGKVYIPVIVKIDEKIHNEAKELILN